MTPRTLILAVAVLLSAGAFAAFCVLDQRSCGRTAATRAGLRIFFDAAAGRAGARALIDVAETQTLDLQAVRSDQKAADAEPGSSCSGLLP